ncbi:hypothetical protein RUM43_008835 [Polyplax serrata]|uniref:WW domain-containing oxidoreductase n=1 Tax=Polyplax serrata TaxID=468196 RepID=A0AAN8S1L7_POLSC
MASVLADSDSEDELPPGWEERATLDGSVYYVNHITKGTQWAHPRTGKKKKVSGDLPPNWEKVIENGLIVYIDHSTNRKTFTDPRLAFATEEKEHQMDFRQRFDGSSTALQVLHGIDLSGKVILITGATSGIGFETAKSLIRHGAEIILCGRSETTCRAAENKILQEYPQAKIRPLAIDLSSLASVKHAAATVRHLYKTLHVLILNAGIFAVGWMQTIDGYESVFQVNHLSHFYLTLLLEDLLKSGSRVVILSSESHRFSSLTKGNVKEEKLNPTTPSGYSDIMAYNHSKLCNVLFATELHKRLSPRGIDVFTVHPGNMVNTGLQKHSCLYRFLFALVRPFTKSLQQAAATSVYAAVATELIGSGGVYLNNCCPCETSKEGQDEEVSQKLWSLSVEMVERVVGPIKPEKATTEIIS